MIDSEKFAAARRASGLTIEDAAMTCGITRQTYSIRERNAGDFRLQEISKLSSALNDSGKALLKEALNDLLC